MYNYNLPLIRLFAVLKDTFPPEGKARIVYKIKAVKLKSLNQGGVCFTLTPFVK